MGRSVFYTFSASQRKSFAATPPRMVAHTAPSPGPGDLGDTVASDLFVRQQPVRNATSRAVQIGNIAGPEFTVSSLDTRTYTLDMTGVSQPA